MRFFPPVVEHHDRSHFDVFVYAVGAKSDDVTDDFRRSVEHYVSMPGAGPEFAERVRADGIDILVDLAGHTMGRALPGLCAEAGADPGLLAGPGQHHRASRRWTTFSATQTCPARASSTCSLRRYGACRVLHSATGRWPKFRWRRRRALERGYITFGSFNNPRKISREAAKLWSAILHLVPQSRLLLKYRGLELDAVQQRLRTWFVEDGIAAERIRFDGASIPLDYLRAFGEIDIGLDPFPYGGGTTTMDALWMGVPVVTLAGRLPVQMSGAHETRAGGFWRI